MMNWFAFTQEESLSYIDNIHHLPAYVIYTISIKDNERMNEWQ
jgi:hypothetical protein